MASPLAAGDRAPEFALPDQDGNIVSSKDLLATGPIVLFFYPVASSGGCTQEACHFRDLSAQFAAVNAHRVGISTDDVAAQKKFDTGNSLGYPLLSDASGDTARAFGVKRNWLGKMAPVKRVTFVIGTDGVIVSTFGSEMKFAEHADQALAALTPAA